ncbi:MAG: acetoacetate decarboxylase family protein [Myxococcales bacterium]|nr:acetoacetate decarboxylase [Myxococcales bacterium]HIK85541.1 acetoacetate decarboxylase [Myxococcales bacterium]
MTFDTNVLKINAGDIAGWPILKIDYPTRPASIAALLPPGISPSAEANVHLSIYCYPVPDEPEFGIVVTVDADYAGEKGLYTLGYGIDQESAIFISRDMNGQPKFPCEVEYYRLGGRVRARCIHQGYTFLEFDGNQAGAAPLPESQVETEWWIKVSRAVGGVEKAYDFPPHVVRVHSAYQPVYRETLDGELRLLDSPWDPIAKLLPMEGEASAYLSTAQPTARDITLEGPLNPDGFWPFVDTIGGSRWPGTQGGPQR